ncbi:TIGR01777 family oxidoreductase [Parendozoicomonas haliclonae]|uniref:Epimerase family protein n=1 Tax=Parendozoicomonas haliclonae TaxID=1960125 RepID=A0A1X7AID9_9GAMM|nr:TIGR01777 family oxidoreductase [Parendozoicomonas haliclonae]SMA43793.1 Epimerase family protein [Parendozoicomonas haliclonae]
MSAETGWWRTGNNKLLLTGGTGFIGRFLVPELLADGWDVVVLSRQNEQAVARVLGHSVKTIRDFNDWPYDEDPAACINLAGEGIMDKRWSLVRKKALRDSRIGLTERLGEWLNQRGARLSVLLSGSAVGYYGTAHGDQPLKEDALAGDDFSARLCADWEAAAAKVPADRLCLIRTGIVLHPNHGALVKLLPPFRMGLGGPVGHGRQVMPWIHIHDMVAAIVHLLNHQSASGAFNMVAPGAVDNREFTKSLGRAVHRPAIFPAPAFVMRLAFGEGAMLLLEGQRPIPAGLESQGFTFRFPSLPEALSDLL